MSDLQASRPQAGIRGLFAGAAKLALGLFLASVALAATLGLDGDALTAAWQQWLAARG